MADRFFEMTLTVPSGTVAVGGYSAVPEELSAVHARDADGRALIPATALRGALRSALEAAVRASDDERKACRGGDGVDPRDQPRGGSGNKHLDPRQCTVDDDHACLPCRLFGSHDSLTALDADGEIGPRPFGALVLGDARAVEACADRSWTVTHGVAIDRAKRSAVEGLLFNRLTPAPGPGLAFVASGRLTEYSAEFARSLEAAAHLTQHIGGGTSRGLGRIDITLSWKSAPPVDGLPPVEGDRRVVVTLKRPACIGVPVNQKNVRRTRVDIPGSTLRGAVGWAIAERLKAAGVARGADDAFEALVAEREGSGGGAIFDFLYPCDDMPPDGITGPWPITRRRCKRDDEHPHTDVLFDRLALRLAEPDDVGRVVDTLAKRARCAACDGPLEPVTTYRGQRRELRTRLVTRVQMDARRRSARDGMLFSNEVIEAGTRYVGAIREIPAGGGGRLAEGLAAPLSLGRGRSRSWGRIAVEVDDLKPPRPPSARREAFMTALRAHQGAFDARFTVPAERLLTLTLTSPLMLAGDAADADVQCVEAALGGRVVLSVRRFGVEGGWDLRNKHATPWTRSVRAGAVYVIEIGDDWSAVAEKVADIERGGIGQGRCRGFGRVFAFDPALSHPERQAVSRSSRKEDPRGPQNRALVQAAEAVMTKAFADRDMRGRLSKSQMSQLIGVCQEAACHDEVANYLRYQAGRRDGSWTTAMASAVIDGMEALFEQQNVPDDADAARMKRWRLYATYLARAFTWHAKVSDNRRSR